MKFDELMKKYRTGTATEAERAQVESEVEKAQLIEEYLAEQDDFPLPEPEEAAPEAGRIRKAVNRRTRLGALWVVLAALLLAAAAQFLLFPALNARVFDHPHEIEAEKGEISEYQLLMDAYTQLHMPLFQYYGSSMESTGFGRWEITDHYFDNQGRPCQSSSSLTCSIFRPDSESFFALRPAVNLFDQSPARDKVAAGLERMDDSVEITAAVRFRGSKDLSGLMTFQNDWTGRTELFSAALEADTRHGPIYMNLLPGAIGWGEEANRDYPLLWLGPEESLTAETYSRHFQSQLRFMMDHYKIAGRLPCPEDYSRVLEDAEKGDLSFAGVLVRGTGRELRQMLDDEAVAGIWPLDAQFILY